MWEPLHPSSKDMVMYALGLSLVNATPQSSLFQRVPVLLLPLLQSGLSKLPSGPVSSPQLPPIPHKVLLGLLTLVPLVNSITQLWLTWTQSLLIFKPPLFNLLLQTTSWVLSVSTLPPRVAKPPIPWFQVVPSSNGSTGLAQSILPTTLRSSSTKF